jgi:putative spermidine/putrescine transport system permease protein
MTPPAIFAGRGGVLGRASDWIWRNPGRFVLLMALPISLWLGIVYVGSLLALLVQSFFSIDEFSGMIVREPTLKTYGELLNPVNLDIIARTVLMAAAVTAAAALVELSGENLCLEADPGQRGHPELDIRQAASDMGA